MGGPAHSRRQHHLSGTLRRTPYNSLSMDPDDMANEGLRDGEAVLVISKHGKVSAKVQAESALRLGVVTLPHGSGALPGSGMVPGSSVNSLIDCTVDYEPDNAMPRMSALPVRVTRDSLEVMN